MTQWKYEGLEQEDSNYADHEFSDGDPCKKYVVSLDKEINEWYGLIFSSDGPYDPFDNEEQIPPEMVTELTALIPDTITKGARTVMSQQQGWNLFDYDNTGLLHIEKDDTAHILESDTAAVEHVRLLAASGDGNARQAIQLHDLNQPKIDEIRVATAKARGE